MPHKLSILAALALVSCAQPSGSSIEPSQSIASVEASSVPAGFTVIEQHPAGYFIRLSSPERTDRSALRTLADALAGKFDRIDLCTDVAHERGDEYVSIIGYQVFDHENDNIYSLNTVSK